MALMNVTLGNCVTLNCPNLCPSIVLLHLYKHTPFATMFPLYGTLVRLLPVPLQIVPGPAMSRWLQTGVVILSSNLTNR